MMDEELSNDMLNWLVAAHVRGWRVDYDKSDSGPVTRVWKGAGQGEVRFGGHLAPEVAARGLVPDVASDVSGAWGAFYRWVRDHDYNFSITDRESGVVVVGVFSRAGRGVWEVRDASLARALARVMLKERGVTVKSWEA